MKKTQSLSAAEKRSGWIGSLLLFAAVGVSMLAMFRGSIPELIFSAVLLAAGLYWIRKFMSGQSLS